MSGPARNPRSRPSRAAGTPGGRPRRVAGQGPGARPRDVEPVEVAAAPPERAPEESAVEQATVEEPTVDQASSTAGSRSLRGVLVALVVAIVLLLAIAAAEVYYLVRPGPTGLDAGETSGQSAELDQLTVLRTVDQAAQAVKAAFTMTPAGFDDEVDAAAALMTDTFAEEFRATKADVRDAVRSQQVSTTIAISAQGVVEAGPDEVVALVFFTQYSQRGDAGAVEPRQFKAEVTMLDTSDGWLVSQVRTL